MLEIVEASLVVELIDILSPYELGVGALECFKALLVFFVVLWESIVEDVAENVRFELNRQCVP